ncbi:MAG: ABC transporter permease, partial [Rhizobacter sp.]|nr:ABC transporter permease [Chlorobiales bacterium]
MPIPISYSIKNVWVRWRTTLFTVLGIALVVFVYTGVLMLSQGIRTTLVATGSVENVIVVQRSAISEISSGIDRDGFNLLTTLPGIERKADGSPVSCGELVVLITQPKRGSGDKVNVTIRGTEPKVLELRKNVVLKEGRMFTPGTSELVVGSGAARMFENIAVGSIITFAQRKWTVVGLFDAGKSGFDSEMWGDIAQ